MKLDLHNFSHNLENKPIHQISNQSNPVYINEVYRNSVSGLFLQELSFTPQKYKRGICGSVHELVNHPQLIRIKLIPADNCGLKQPDTQLASPDTVFLNDKYLKNTVEPWYLEFLTNLKTRILFNCPWSWHTQVLTLITRNLTHTNKFSFSLSVPVMEVQLYQNTRNSSNGTK